MGHKRFPEKFAFLLNNRIRHLLNPPDRLISTLDVRPNDVVVDFGCGPAFFTVELCRKAGRTIGVDLSQRMLEKAASYARKKRVMAEFIQSDGTQITLSDTSVDLILLIHVFHEIEDKPLVLKEFRRILKAKARLAIIEKTRKNGILSRFGPPIIDEAEVVGELTDAGFTSACIIPHGLDSVIISEKAS